MNKKFKRIFSVQKHSCFMNNKKGHHELGPGIYIAALSTGIAAVGFTIKKVSQKYLFKRSK